MVEVQVPVHWVVDGQCGPLCARHGEATDRGLRRQVVTPVPGWAYALLLLGALPFAVVVAATRQSVRGAVPGCVRCVRERRRWVLAVLGAWVLVVALFVLAVQQDSAGLGVVAVLAACAALVALATGERLRVRATLVRDAPWVRLRGVDPRFAAGVRQALAEQLGAVPGAVLPTVLPAGR